MNDHPETREEKKFWLIPLGVDKKAALLLHIQERREAVTPERAARCR